MQARSRFPSMVSTTRSTCRRRMLLRWRRPSSRTSMRQPRSAVEARVRDARGVLGRRGRARTSPPFVSGRASKASMCPTEAGFPPLLFGSTTRSIEHRCSCRRGQRSCLSIEGRRDRPLWRSELTRGDVGQESHQRRNGLHRGSTVSPAKMMASVAVHPSLVATPKASRPRPAPTCAVSRGVGRMQGRAKPTRAVLRSGGRFGRLLGAVCGVRLPRWLHIVGFSSWLDEIGFGVARYVPRPDDHHKLQEVV
jgi:hypothetical protein